MAAPVAAHGLASRLPAQDVGLYPPVFQHIPEPVSVVAPIQDHLLGSGQTAQQGGGSGVVADPLPDEVCIHR